MKYIKSMTENFNFTMDFRNSNFFQAYPENTQKVIIAAKIS